MSGLDRIIKAERKRKYKRLKKLRKARDMASKYSKHKLLLSKVFKLVKRDNIDECLFTSDLAKYILDRQLFIVGVRPPKPPSQNK